METTSSSGVYKLEKTYLNGSKKQLKRKLTGLTILRLSMILKRQQELQLVTG